MPFVTDELYFNKMRNKKFLLENTWPKKIKLGKIKKNYGFRKASFR